MGQKIHPTGFRLAVTRGWTSRWFAAPRDFAKMLKQDVEIREYVKKKLGHAGIGKVVIERPSKSARITLQSARPGVVIGKKGEGIEKLRQDMQKKLGVQVAVNIEELRKPELEAQIIADGITQQLEKRVMFRRAMRRAIQQAMRLGAQGIKITCGGRLNGIEIARSESYREGRVPMHTLRANIDYALSEAKTTYGIIGCKVWVYRGDMLMPEQHTEAQKEQISTLLEGAEAVDKDKNAPRTIKRIVKKEGEAAEVVNATVSAQAPVTPAKKPVAKAKKVEAATTEATVEAKKTVKKAADKTEKAEKPKVEKAAEKTTKAKSVKKDGGE